MSEIRVLPRNEIVTQSTKRRRDIAPEYREAISSVLDNPAGLGAVLVIEPGDKIETLRARLRRACVQLNDGRFAPNQFRIRRSDQGLRCWIVDLADAPARRPRRTKQLVHA